MALSHNTPCSLSHNVEKKGTIEISKWAKLNDTNTQRHGDTSDRQLRNFVPLHL